MPSLLEFQLGFRHAILADDPGTLTALIAAPGDDGAQRIDIYRNNVLSSLTDALCDMFPVVRSLVGEGFFAFAAHEFICRLPPNDPCVAAYGEGFADFLAGFPPCQEIVYLADVARFERLLGRAARAADGIAITPDALSNLDTEDAARLAFRIQPSFGYLRSPWPVARIWRANQPDVPGDDTIDLGEEGVLLEVRRGAEAVEFRELPPARFAFRTALAAGALFADAAGACTGDDFDINTEFAALFTESALAGFELIGERSTC